MLQINEVGTVGERIIQLVNHFCQGNKTAFGRAADIQSGVLAGFVGGRASKPGFEILQKMLTAYPTVSPDWLLFGRGSMLRQGEAASSASGEVLDPFSGSGGAIQQLITSPPYANWQELETQVAEVNKRLDAIDGQVIQRKADEEAAGILYRVTGPPNTSRPYDGLLSTRLDTTEPIARELVDNRVLDVIRLGNNPDDVDNWRVSELTIRKFLSRPPSGVPPKKKMARHN